MRNLARLFENPDNSPFAWRDGEIIDFHQFQTDVAANVHKLKNITRAALTCRDSYNFTVGFFALLHAGATIVLPSNPQSDLAHEYDLLVDDAYISKKSAGSGPLGKLDAKRLSCEFFTSGSTGEPKRISKSVGMLQNEVETLDKLWGDKIGRGIVFATVPHQHFYSLIFKILWPLASARPFSNNMHGLWEELLPELKNDSVIISSPAHLERLGGITTKHHPSQIFCAGARLSPEAARQVEKTFHCLPTEIFGSTETGAIATRRQIQGDEDWQPLPGVQIKTDDSGALQVLSPFIGPEYFPTSDLIEKTPTGFAYKGRADRIVKIAGKRVSLPEVEQAIFKLNMIESAAIVYLKDRERLAAAVILDQNGREKLAELGNFRLSRVFREELMASFEPAAIPKLWRFVENLPKHMLGKQRDTDIIALFDL